MYLWMTELTAGSGKISVADFVSFLRNGFDNRNATEFDLAVSARANLAIYVVILYFPNKMSARVKHAASTEHDEVSDAK